MVGPSLVVRGRARRLEASGCRALGLGVTVRYVKQGLQLWLRREQQLALPTAITLGRDHPRGWGQEGYREAGDGAEVR